MVYFIINHEFITKQLGPLESPKISFKCFSDLLLGKVYFTACVVKVIKDHQDFR